MEVLGRLVEGPQAKCADLAGARGWGHRAKSRTARRASCTRARRSPAGEGYKCSLHTCTLASPRKEVQTGLNGLMSTILRCATSNRGRVRDKARATREDEGRPVKGRHGKEKHRKERHRRRRRRRRHEMTTKRAGPVIIVFRIGQGRSRHLADRKWKACNCPKSRLFIDRFFLLVSFVLFVFCSFFGASSSPVFSLCFSLSPLPPARHSAHSQSLARRLGFLASWPLGFLAWPSLSSFARCLAGLSWPRVRGLCRFLVNHGGFFFFLSLLGGHSAGGCQSVPPQWTGRAAAKEQEMGDDCQPLKRL